MGLATVTSITAPVASRNAGLISPRAQPYKLQTQPDRDSYPPFHPLSNTYEHSFDLREAALAFADETNINTSIKSRSFPRDVFSTWERVESSLNVPRMAGQVAAINHGLTELNSESIVVARIDLWKRVKATNGLRLKDQTRIDGALEAAYYYPAAQGGVRQWSIRATEEFGAQLSGAAKRVGVYPHVLATVCMCRALWEQPGVNSEAEDMLRGIYTDFLDACEWSTDTLNGGFLAACARSLRQ